MSANSCGCDPDSDHKCERHAVLTEVREMLLRLRHAWNHEDKGWLALDQALDELEMLS